VSIIRGSKNDFSGTITAKDQDKTREKASEHFTLTAEQIKRLIVRPLR
jgi:hypothetical protein